MSPFQHGEVFVTDDGAETDLDLGHYERFTHARLTQSNNLTSGRIYEQIIAARAPRRLSGQDRAGDSARHQRNQGRHEEGGRRRGRGDRRNRRHGGRHRIAAVPRSHPPDAPRSRAASNCLFVHVTLVPWIAAAQELKTKPTQHSVKELRAIGIQPDILLCRCERFIPQEMKEKIALFCDVDVEAVVTARDVKSVYEVPVDVRRAKAWTKSSCGCCKLDAPPRDLSRWTAMLERMQNPRDEVTIGLVGKYVEYEDSYKSLKEALLHGGLAHELKVNIHWIEAEGVVGDDWERQLRRLRRHPGARRLRQARHRRHAERHPLRARAARCRTSASASACRPW